VIPPAARAVPAFLPPEPREEVAEVRYREAPPWGYEYRRDVSRRITSFEWTNQSAFVNHGRHYRTDERNYYETNDDRPADSRFSGEAKTAIDLKDRKLEFRSTFDVRSDEKNFHVRIIRHLFEDDALLRQREWNETIPRIFN